VGMERAAKCKHDVLVTSPPVSFTHAPQTVVCPVLGTITKKSIGPIPIPPNTGKYWPIPNTGIVRTLIIRDLLYVLQKCVG